ncbi:MAG: hypothetical protein J0H12_02685 [Candidatus Paracaedimonas acanthamoebae]|uniref:Uncharacterized protein n=1 Tax=Candidatus Paracaedimonas acanthamoebae TaxID=244581 RepID=A0A8J7PIK6_9PROT|nr:hypothetical protein [Candidatus Paracaedimonas acanthamoebae]
MGILITSKNKLFLFVFLSTFFFQNPIVATEADIESNSAKKQLTLIVGNTYEKGWVKPSVAKLIGQDAADFTHINSFQGRVVSVDLAPLHQKGDYEHLALDFVKTKPEKIIEALGSPPTCIFFEWFPSCVENEPENNITPLLLPAQL